MNHPPETRTTDQDATLAKLTRRQRLLWTLYDFSQGQGLEIGPLHQTAVPKSHADVVYLDVFDRQTLVSTYANNPGVPCELIPDVDHVLLDGGRVRSIPETVGSQARFDWVVASHVIEHVPDVIGWLNDLADVTADGGHLILAVPDRRYCFDLHRPGTTIGQLLQAHELGDVVPSIRAVYDYKRGHASVPAATIWAGQTPGYERRIYSLDTVLSEVERARSGEYVDSHVWTFTPGTLLEQIVELRSIGLSSWKVRQLTPTKKDELEFYAILERLPRDTAWSDELLVDEPPLPPLPDWVAEHTQVVQQLAAARAKIERLRRQNARLKRQDHNRVSNQVKRRLKDLPGGELLIHQAQRLLRTVLRKR